MDKSFQLIKAFDKPEHAEGFRNGNIHLRSVQYYRTIEDNRRNSDEFKVTFTEATYEFVNPALLLCSHNNSVTNLNMENLMYVF